MLQPYLCRELFQVREKRKEITLRKVEWRRGKLVFRLTVTLTQRLNTSCEADNEDRNKLQIAKQRTLFGIRDYRQILMACPCPHNQLH